MPDVYLNVYELTDQTATSNTLSAVGLGLYHSGVEFSGFEYSFSQQGIVRTCPCLPDFGILCEHLNMGTFRGTKSDFDEIVGLLRAGDFQPGQYDVVHRNCNHFSDAICGAALGVSIPPWVNRAASLGENV